MSIWLSIALTLSLILASVPLALFATLTSFFAFSTLLLRALIVYAELAAVLLQFQFATLPASIPPSATSDSNETTNQRLRSAKGPNRRSSAASLSSTGGSITPKLGDTNGLDVYASDHTRDFEGVGGWRMPGSNDEDILWAHLNSRLELPGNAEGRQRNHYRSKTATNPWATPSTSKSTTPAISNWPTSSSPEYFTTSKSTTSLDTAGLGRRLARHKS